MIYLTDDVCPSNLVYFKCWDRIKKKNSDLKLIAFTIANNGYKEDISKSRKFKNWYEQRKDWVTIGVHGYDHTYPPEGERDDQEDLIKKSLDILKPYLPESFLYRAPGFQVTCRTEPILRKLGFSGIAHQSRIKYFDGRFETDLINTHCCDKWHNPITKIWRDLC